MVDKLVACRQRDFALVVDHVYNARVRRECLVLKLGGSSGALWIH